MSAQSLLKTTIRELSLFHGKHRLLLFVPKNMELSFTTSLAFSTAGPAGSLFTNHFPLLSKAFKSLLNQFLTGILRVEPIQDSSQSSEIILL